MSILSNFFIKKTPVNNTSSNTLQVSETVIKAKELVNRYEDLKSKINDTENTIELLKYALCEGKDSVVLRITRFEPGVTWDNYDRCHPVEHILYMNELTKETLLKNMLSDSMKQLNKYETEYKKL